MNPTKATGKRGRCRRCEMVRLGLVVTTMLICAMLLHSTAQAADWWKSGAELLDRFGKAQATGGSAEALATEDIQAGLLEALRVGTKRVVAQLSAEDGFNADPRVHIPLPPALQQAARLLDQMGMGAIGEDLELKLNRAAEAATPEAKQLFLDAIGQMSFADARAIFEGPDNAATEYFRQQMSSPLAERMQPIVEQALAEVGALQLYDQFMGQYRQLPLVPDLRADLQQHVVDRGIAGIFDYVAVEEAAIRADPAARTTDLLQRVFGAGS